MADIFLPGASMTEFMLAEDHLITVIANTDQAAGGGVENGIHIYSANNNGWMISTNTWLGATGPLYIARIGADDFCHSNLVINEQNSEPYATLGIKLNPRGLIRFSNFGQDVDFGRFPGAVLTRTISTPYPVSQSSAFSTNWSLKIQGAKNAWHHLQNNRFYFYSRADLLEDPFNALCYVELVHGFPCFRFSSSSLMFVNGELYISLHVHKRTDDRSLDSTPMGFIRVPEDSLRSIVVLNALGELAGTVQVSGDPDVGTDKVTFTSGDLAWEE